MSSSNNAKNLCFCVYYTYHNIYHNNKVKCEVIEKIIAYFSKIAVLKEHLLLNKTNDEILTLFIFVLDNKFKYILSIFKLDDNVTKLN